MLSSKTSLIDVNLPTNLTFDPNKIYYLQLYNLSYSNVWANIKQNLYISPGSSWILDGSPVPEVIIPAGSLYSLETIYEKIKEATNDAIEISINDSGKCVMIFNGLTTIQINQTDLGILNTPYCGVFDQAITSVLTPVTSSQMASVSDFNKLLLNCNICNSSTYITYNDKVNTTTALLSVSSQGKPYEYIEYVSRVPLLYPISLTNLQRIIISLKDENNNELTQVPQTNSDFYVWISINEKI